MDDSFLQLDPAVDVISSEKAVHFRTPRGSFAMKDASGMVAKVATKCREGAKSETILSEFTSLPERDAASELIGFLKSRHVLADAAETPRRPQPEPLVDWIRHYAGVGNRILPSVEVRGDGYLADNLKTRLSVVGFRSAPKGDVKSACIIAASDRPDIGFLRGQQNSTMTEGQAYLPVWLDRSIINWGPMVLPHATGCLECRLHREHAVSRRSEPLLLDQVQLTVSPALAELASVLALGEILRWALDAHVDTDHGVAWAFDWLSLSLSGATVLRLPQCPVCGSATRVKSCRP